MWLSYREQQSAFWESFYWLLAGLWRFLSYAETKYCENQWECFNWLSYAGGALIKVADSAGSTVYGFCVWVGYGATIAIVLILRYTEPNLRRPYKVNLVTFHIIVSFSNFFDPVKISLSV